MRSLVLFVSLAAYLVVGWMVSLFVAYQSAWHNGPCETNDCPEGVESDWVLLVPIGFLVGFIVLMYRGIQWVLRRRREEAQKPVSHLVRPSSLE